MKISLRWIWRHLDAENFDYSSFRIDEFVSLFSLKVAEIESAEKWNLDRKSVFAARPSKSKFLIDELNVEVDFSLVENVMDDCQEVWPEDVWQLFVKTDRGFRALSYKDLGLEKEGSAARCFIGPDGRDGRWKNSIEWSDVVLTVDNATLTNRPDMWAVRGFSQEVATLLDLDLLPEKEFLAKVDQIYTEDAKKASDANSGLSVKVNDFQVCRMFSALHLNVKNRPSGPGLIFDLARVGQRSHGLLVDLSNYICFDWGQPVHVFDASKVAEKSLVVRSAKNGECLELLDGQKIEFFSNELVVADKNGPLSLAGVKGGARSAVSDKTSSIIFESATFLAENVRRASTLHKIRTDSSARFEKNLDTRRGLEAPLRFVKLLEEFSIPFEFASSIVSVGSADKTVEISVSHQFLEQKIGIGLKEADVTGPLTRLGFSVEIDSHYDDVVYHIFVPSARATKNIRIAEDIVEEVARHYGFLNIPAVVPALCRLPEGRPDQLDEGFRDCLTLGARMIEQYNYVWNDVDLAQTLGIDYKSEIEIQNPVNKNTTYLSPTLVLGLIKNVANNAFLSNQLRFFTLGRVWSLDSGVVVEKKACSGIFFQKKGDLNLGQCRAEILKALHSLGYKSINFKPARAIETFGFENKDTIFEIEINGICVGRTGTVDRVVWSKLDLPDASALYFEIDCQKLSEIAKDSFSYKPIVRQAIQHQEMSFLVGPSVKAAVIAKALSDVSKSIVDVVLLDVFEKPEWNGRRSLAFRLQFEGLDGPLSKLEIDSIVDRAWAVIKNLGGEAR